MGLALDVTANSAVLLTCSFLINFLQCLNDIKIEKHEQYSVIFESRTI